MGYQLHILKSKETNKNGRWAIYCRLAHRESLRDLNVAGAKYTCCYRFRNYGTARFYPGSYC